MRGGFICGLRGKAEATSPGKNGKIVYSGYDGNDYEIYTINLRGGDNYGSAQHKGSVLNNSLEARFRP
jgi:hypothetical protein